MKKRGRSLLLGDDLDEKVRLYLKNVRKGGGVVSARIAMAAARGILLSYDKYRYWAYSLLTRMNFVKRKATTAKSKYTGSNFEEAKKSFLTEVVTIASSTIDPELGSDWFEDSAIFCLDYGFMWVKAS